MEALVQPRLHCASQRFVEHPSRQSQRSCLSVRSCRASGNCTPQLPSHFAGLRTERPGALGCRRPNLQAAFFGSVRAATAAPARRGQQRGVVTMMPIGTPMVPYRTPGEGGWQWIDIWNVLYRERIIFIGQHIDEEFGNNILATMLYLDSIDSNKPIYLYFNSPGGEITPVMALLDTIDSVGSPVGTLSLGYAYNMAAVLLLSGTKGLRTAMPLTRVALQMPAGAARGRADDIDNEAKELARVRTRLFDTISERTGQPVEKIGKDLDRIRRFSAEQALEYGIIDKIVRPQRIKPMAEPREGPRPPRERSIRAGDS